MARITLIPRDQAPSDLSALVGDSPTSNLDVFLHRPEFARAYAAMHSALISTGTLPRRLVELVRLRVAYHNQCRSCMAIRYEDGVAEGVTEQLVCQLDRPQEAADLTPAEVSALSFADKLATNHLGITEETFDDLRQWFNEDEIVELGINIAMYVGFGRLASAWDLVDELPDEFRVTDRTSLLTPWGSESLLVHRGGRDST